MENVTASEIAGLGVGTLLLCATIAAPKIDAFISSAQRKSLGMCRQCGDVKQIACSRCKGSGSVKTGGFFGSESDHKFLPCSNCAAEGHFPCPLCSTPSLL